ncbi:MAG: carbohydrate binding domain-containing protein [Armatimonadetes bacterium]|nr:carbohydrate binding domain-containing protein [Armatimonadota bacterium]
MTSRVCLFTCVALAAGVALAQDAPVLHNGDFEQIIKASPGMNNWTLGEPPQRPEGWSLNTAYPGTLTIGTDDAHSGERYLHIQAADDRPAHIFQIRDNLQVGQWYRISLWIRGGPVTLYVYEYFNGRPMRVPIITQGTSAPDEWRQIFGYYRPDADDFKNAGPAIAVGSGYSADIDDVVMEPLELPVETDVGPDVVLENDSTVLTLAGNGKVRSLVSKATGEDYASPDVPFPFVEVIRAGNRAMLHSVALDGDLLRFTFLDTDVHLALRVTPDRRSFVFEVAQVEPDDVERITLEIPVRDLGNVATAFDATYNDEFGMCMFGGDISTFNAGTSRAQGSWSMRAWCGAEHGMTGAKFILVAAPRDEFNDAIMEAEQANGLPCPILDGQWARFSDRARESYLFATSVHEDDIDTLIDYAKLGGFKTIIILKNSWLANHGHYDVNLDSFPGGRASLKRAVDKIHAAGLHAGVHVFGPSISPNDPYVTPVPDDRLEYVTLTPLAEDLDAEATTITLTEQPDLAPPRAPRTRAFPGYHLRIGDELISYSNIEEGPPYRFVGCKRGALGTTAAPHPAGSEVRHMLTQWSFFRVQPDSTLADELTANFADVFNYCGFDMVYFDASDGGIRPYTDPWYYLNRMHLGFWNSIGRDVLYQTSNGTGHNMLWHIVPRSASADGHGDIKGYLDERWPGIMTQARNFTRSDIGWYYMFKNVRPDQIEYVRAKALSIGGSISIEASRASLEALPLARKTFEMLRRYEDCRLAGAFPEATLAKMREPGRDFKLFEDDGRFSLYRAAYEEPRSVDALDGAGNVWHITNDLDEPCELGVEIVRGARRVATGGYANPKALTIEDFSDADLYRLSETNRYEKYVKGVHALTTDGLVAMEGVTQSLELSDDTRVGAHCLMYSARNEGAQRGWTGIGRRFDPPLDLSGYAGIGLWIYGDARGERLRVQLRDTKGRFCESIPEITFSGWSLHTFAFPADAKFDRSQVEYLLFYFNSLPRGEKVQVRLAGVRALPDMSGGDTLEQPALVVNGRRTVFPVTLQPGEAVTCDGPDGARFWRPGMEPGQALNVFGPVLQPGGNTVTLEVADPARFPGNVNVILYRMWPIEE